MQPRETIGPEIPPIVELQRTISSFKEVYYLKDQKLGERNLLDFIAHYMDSLITTGEDRAHVLFVEGPPGAGKSYLTDNTILPYAKEKMKGLGGNITLLRWDNVEDELLELIEQTKRNRSNGLEDPSFFTELVKLLTTKKHPTITDDNNESLIKKEANLLLGLEVVRGVPYPQDFLNATAAAIEIKLTDEIQKEKPYSLIIVEKPAATSLPRTKVNPPGTKRDYGSEMIRDLDQKIKSFDEIFGIDLCLGYIGVVSTPAVDPLIIAREVFQYTRTMRNKELALLLANQAADACKLPHFTQESLANFSEGGSIEQVLTARYAASKSLELAEIFNRSQQIPQSIKYAYNRLYYSVEYWKSQLTQNTREERKKREDDLFDDISLYLAIAGEETLLKLIREARESSETFGEPIMNTYHVICMLGAAALLDETANCVEPKNRIMILNDYDYRIHELIKLLIIVRGDLFRNA